VSIPFLGDVDTLPASSSTAKVLAPERRPPRGPVRRGLAARALRFLLACLRWTAVGVVGAHWLLLVVVIASSLAWGILRPPASLLMAYRWASTGKPVRALRYVPLEKLPRTVRTMLVRLEDYTFYEHHGIDLAAIKDAARINKIVGWPMYGGSTITQQLARTLYLTPHKSYVRKYLEAIIAVTMEGTLGKERILELYLNYVEWGPGVYGIGAAASYHFGKDIGSLTVDEYRRLLTLLSSPIRYGVWSFDRNRQLAERYAYLVSRFPSL
jgi:monofunctional glycosyltransferase